MDADDIALPQLLATQVDFLDSHPEIDISGVNLEYFNERDEVSNLPTQPNFSLHAFPILPVVFDSTN